MARDSKAQLKAQKGATQSAINRHGRIRAEMYARQDAEKKQLKASQAAEKARLAADWKARIAAGKNAAERKQLRYNYSLSRANLAAIHKWQLDSMKKRHGYERVNTPAWR